MTPEQISTYNKAYERAVALMSGGLLLDGATRAEDPGVPARLRQSLACLDTCLELVPTAFACAFLSGKIHQALGEREKALEWFARATELERANPDSPREATIEALHLGRAADASRFAREACRRAVLDAGLVANLALASLIGGNLEEALKAAARAVEMDGNDRVNRSVLGLVQDVSTGARPRPTKIG